MAAMPGETISAAADRCFRCRGSRSGYIPHSFALGFSEAPRGDDIHWSMTGDNQKLYRWRCRAATYANWPTLRYMLRGNTVSDAPLIIGSLDPCYSCTDRMTVAYAFNVILIT